MYKINLTITQYAILNKIQYKYNKKKVRIIYDIGSGQFSINS